VEIQRNPAQTDLVAKEREARERYMRILHSSLSLVKQQCKQTWLNLGDHCTKLFFAKMRQRRLQSYIYTIRNDQMRTAEGFDQVAKVIVDYYQGMLGEQPIVRE